jgi:hypothetical protein
MNTGASRTLRHVSLLCLLAVIAFAVAPRAEAMPAFARQYDMSCAACHDAFPRLNGSASTSATATSACPTGAKRTRSTPGRHAGAAQVSAAGIRAQAYVQARQGEHIDEATGPTAATMQLRFSGAVSGQAAVSAPLSDHITYYFYGIFAEKGGNGETLIEDAWFRHDDAFGSGVGAMLGQFQVSDLMFPREIRLTFQDFMAYRAAGITYDRGVLFDRGFGPVDVALGAVNGNGITPTTPSTAPAIAAPTHVRQRHGKSVFGRIGAWTSVRS